MLKTIVDAGVPALVFSAMVVVGMDLTTDDWRRIARRPGIVVAATLGQFILLPLLGWLLVAGLGLDGASAHGVLLVAVCPSGTMANLYTSQARANVALSVTLTAVSCLAAVVVTPLLLSLLQTQAGGAGGYSVPFGVLAGQLIVLLLVPVLTGMIIRHRWPHIPKRHRRGLLAFSVAALIVLLALVIAQAGEQFARMLAEIAVAAFLLTILAFGSGWLTGWLTGAGANDRFAVAMSFVVRNVGIATAIAVTTLGRAEFAVFATAYFLTQTPLLLAAALIFRWLRLGQRGPLTEPASP